MEEIEKTAAENKYAGPRRPVFFVEYDKKDITAYLTPYLLSVTYVDKLTGEADELELRLEDRAGLWRGAWYPQKGDQLRLTMGYQGETMLDCGVFEVDEIELEGPPDTVMLKGLAAAVSKAVRTKISKAYDGMDLDTLAKQVADQHGLKKVGDVELIYLGRVTQNQETDLAFLSRIASQYGYLVAVRDKQLFFSQRESTMDRQSVLQVHRKQMKRYRFTDKTSAIYRAATVSYLDPKSNKLLEFTAHDKALAKQKHADVLKLNARAENKQQAEVMAKAALKEKNLKATEGEVTLIGDVRAIAGNSLDVLDMGVLDGQYQITQSRHTMQRSAGYETAVTLQRLGAIQEKG